MDYLNFLQDYNGAATAIAAFLALLLNGFSVALAAFLWRENRKLREESSEPNIAIFLHPIERFPTIAHIVVANIGKGPANNIKISHSLSEDEIKHYKIHDRSFALFKGQRMLPQGERLSFFFGEWQMLLSKPPLPPFNVLVSYEALGGRKLQASFKLDVSEFHGLRLGGTPPDHEMAMALKAIADEIKRWGTGFTRLKVETITSQEQNRIDREHYEQIEAQFNKPQDGET